MKKKALIHPFLFVIYPVLLLYSNNIQHVSLQEMLIPVGVIIGVTLLVMILLSWGLDSLEKAGAITSISLVFFFFYGYIHDAIELLTPVRHRYLLPALGLLFILVNFFVLKKKSNLKVLTNFLNVVVITLLVITLTDIGTFVVNSGTSTPQSALEIPSSKQDEKGTERDIYYIILERYGAEETLEEIYDFSNEKFLNYLSNKGFYIASESRANYLKTAHSLASSLNLEYINYLSKKVEKPDNWKPIYQKLTDYKVWRFLKNNGYDFIHLGGWWEPTRKNEYADVSLSFGASSEFSSVLASTTAIYPVLSELGIGRRKENYEATLERFNRLKKVPENDNLTFTFAHMFITHTPYNFDKNCQYLSEAEEEAKEDKRNYIDQLICANKKLKKLINDLLSQYKNPKNLPIIIIQGDEGPYPKRYRENREVFDWKNEATREELKQKTRIINAYYLPGGKKDKLYPSITPVNTFRLLFNEYFNTDLTLLSDRTYSFRDNGHIYDFFDITEIVDYD